jgi:hypothetical protein
MRLPSAALDDAGLEPILEQLRAFVVARDRDVVPRLARSTWDDRRPGLLGVAGAGELGATLADALLPARPAHVPVAVGRLAVEGELGERLLRAARPAPLRRRRGIAVDGLDDVYAVPPGLELGRRGPVAVLGLDVRAAVASACELGLELDADELLDATLDSLDDVVDDVTDENLERSRHASMMPRRTPERNARKAPERPRIGLDAIGLPTRLARRKPAWLCSVLGLDGRSGPTTHPFS